MTEESLSIAPAARDLDINDNLLSRWKKELEAQGQQAFPGHGHSLEDELVRLRLVCKSSKRGLLRAFCLLAHVGETKKSSTYNHKQQLVQGVCKFCLNIGHYVLERNTIAIILMSVTSLHIAQCAKVSHRSVQLHLAKTRPLPSNGRWEFDLLEFPDLVMEIRTTRKRKRENVFNRPVQET